ncbi:MAG: methyltransferase domain-containing protein [bacterium]
MPLQEKSRAESPLLSNVDQSRLEESYNQLIRELSIFDGQKVLTLCRGTWESAQDIVKRNPNGQLYVVVGPGDREGRQISGWTQSRNMTFLYSRLTELPLPDAFLDRVIVIYSAILFKFKQAIVKEVCRVLKPGGIFYVLYFDVKEINNACYFEIRKDYYPST